MNRCTKFYAPAADVKVIAQAVRLSGSSSVSSFCRRAAVERARDVVSRFHSLPGSEEYQREIVRRAMRNGCFSIDDLLKQTGLDELALKSALGELSSLGEVEQVKGPRRQELIYVLIDRGKNGNGKS